VVRLSIDVLRQCPEPDTFLGRRIHAPPARGSRRGLGTGSARQRHDE
jgi:hypothetical protein